MVRIANPIYDAVFKHLMESRVVARGLLSELLQTEILELDPKPQEITDRVTLASRVGSEDSLIHVFRVDFSAVIKDREGQLQKVLIELQKAGKNNALERFRHYLGKHYAIPSKVETPLPIVGVYVLGFWLNKLLPPVVRVQRKYLDVLDGRELAQREPFIEQLTHDAVVVQLPALPNRKSPLSHEALRSSPIKPPTELELALESFNQSNSDGDPRFLHLTEAQIKQGPPWIVEMFNILAKVAGDPNTQAQMAVEDEVKSMVDEAEEERRQKEEERRQKEEALRELSEQRALNKDAKREIEALRAQIAALVAKDPKDPTPGQ
jgi:hypothetical protein